MRRLFSWENPIIHSILQLSGTVPNPHKEKGMEKDLTIDNIYSNDEGPAGGEKKMLDAFNGMTVNDLPLETPSSASDTGNCPGPDLKKCTRPVESGLAQNSINLTARQLICIDGKMFKITDLSKNMVCCYA
jgi:hypothetical protein